MSNFNYRWHRSRYKPKVVKRLPKAGMGGTWVKVSDAVALTGMARSTIAKRYLTGAWDSVMYNKMIYVKLPFSPDEICQGMLHEYKRRRGH